MKKDFNELFEQTLIRKVQEQDPNHVINNNQYKVIKDFVLYYNFRIRTLKKYGKVIRKNWI